METAQINEIDELISIGKTGDAKSKSRAISMTRGYDIEKSENLFKYFRQKGKYHHAHFFAYHIGTLNRSKALEFFKENSSDYPPSMYCAGRIYYDRGFVSDSIDFFSKGWEKGHFFSGKMLSDLYLRGNIKEKYEAIKIRLILFRNAMFDDIRGESRFKYVKDRF